MQRRRFLASGLLLATGVAAGGAVAGPHNDLLYESLRQPGRIALPDQAVRQRVMRSPAPMAANPGQWLDRPALPLPRGEMVWAAELNGRMHLVGGYAEQRVNRDLHHVYDPAGERWLYAPPLPVGANRIGLAVLDGMLYAIGGFTAQNFDPHDRCFVFDGRSNGWRAIAPLPRPCGAVACAAVEARLHAVGGAVGESLEERRSVDWHLAYDPAEDRWETRAPLRTVRDHAGIAVLNGLLHLIGGRVDTFYTNSNLHHAYDPETDRWEARAPLPTARSGHGTAVYRGRIFCIGGEGSQRVFAHNEAYDPAADGWEQYAPMPVARHGMGAAVIGDFLHLAGGGPVTGGSIQSAAHEAFTLG